MDLNHRRIARASFLFLAFLIPAQPLLQVRSYRIVEAFVVLLAVYAHFTRSSDVRLPWLLSASFWIGLIGYVITSATAAYPATSFDHGALIILIPFLVLYTLLAMSPDRAFYVKAISLFAIGVLLMSAVQMAEILQGYKFLVETQDAPERWLAFRGGDFAYYKNVIPQAFPASGIPIGYGNTDNFASLWTLLVPLCVGIVCVARRKIFAIALLVATIYCGLYVFSRGSLVCIAAGLAALIILQLRHRRSIIVATATLVALVVITADEFASYRQAVSDFSVPAQSSAKPQGLLHLAQLRESPPKIIPRPEHDESAVDRAAAWRLGLSFGLSHPLNGIGYGAYPIFEPRFTAPHSLALMRFATGGVLGLISFLLLALYAPVRLFQLARSRTGDELEIVCLVAISAFMLKAIVFGAEFAVSSNFVWGFGVALLLAASVSKRQGKTA